MSHVINTAGIALGSSDRGCGSILFGWLHGFAEYGFRVSWGYHENDEVLIMVLIKADRGVADRKESAAFIPLSQLFAPMG